MNLTWLSNPKNEFVLANPNKKYQGDTFIIMPEESQCGSIKCAFGKNCKNGILSVFIDAESTAVRGGVMDPVSLDRQCNIHPKSPWDAHLVLSQIKA